MHNRLSQFWSIQHHGKGGAEKGDGGAARQLMGSCRIKIRAMCLNTKTLEFAIAFSGKNMQRI
jgi:hypothetical protein